MENINYLFVVVVISLSIGALVGYKRGFLRIAVSLIGLLVVIVISLKLSPFVSEYVTNNTQIYDSAKHKIVELYDEKNGTLDNSISENQNLTIKSYNLPDLISSALVTNNTSEMYSILAASLFEEYIAGYLAVICIKAGSFIAVFIALEILLFLLKLTIKIIEKIPVLKTFNKILGLVAGVSTVLIFVWVFYIGIMMFFADSLGEWLLAQINSSTFLTFLFNNNMLFKMLLK